MRTTPLLKFVPRMSRIEGFNSTRMSIYTRLTYALQMCHQSEQPSARPQLQLSAVLDLGLRGRHGTWFDPQRISLSSHSLEAWRVVSEAPVHLGHWGGGEEKGREERREGEREGGKEGGRERGREGERERARERGRGDRGGKG